MIQKEAKKRMARYTKLRKTKPKRTMLKGLRPFSDKFQDGFSPKMIQEMKERIEKIVANNRVLDKKDRWLLNHILKVAEFRLAIQEKNEKKQETILIEINRGEKRCEEKGDRFLAKAEIWGANRAIAVLQEEKGSNFKTFIEKLEKIISKK